MLRVRLPQGASLVSGLIEEQLPESGPGVTIERRFVVQGAGSVVVTVDATSTAGGAHAEATFPEPAAKPAAPTQEMTPMPPARLHGVTIDQAVPVTGQPETAK